MTKTTTEASLESNGKEKLDKKEKKEKKEKEVKEKSNFIIILINNKANRDHCNICKDGGKLILCDNCPRAFHTKCLKATEKDIDQSMNWYCKVCKYINCYN